MYSPEYAMRDLTEVFEQLAKEGKLPEDVNAYLHEAWKENEGKGVLVGQTVHCFCGIRISSENQLTNYKLIEWLLVKYLLMLEKRRTFAI